MRVGAIALIGVVKVERQAENVKPYIESIGVDVGVHRLLENRAVVNEMLEVQVLGNVGGIFLAGNELVSEGHVDEVVVAFFKGGYIRFITDFYAHFAIAPVGIFFNRHDTGHRIELVYIFL